MIEVIGKHIILNKGKHIILNNTNGRKVALPIDTLFVSYSEKNVFVGNVGGPEDSEWLVAESAEDILTTLNNENSKMVYAQADILSTPNK